MRSSLILILKELILPVLMTLMIVRCLYHFHMIQKWKLQKNTRKIVCVVYNHTYMLCYTFEMFSSQPCLFSVMHDIEVHKTEGV